MLVVADSSPINILVRIGCVDVLPQLFQTVLIPPEVQTELTHAATPDSVRAFMRTPPRWLEVRAVPAREPIPIIDAGEQAAIHLAMDIRAGAILLDDKYGRRAARERGLRVVGTLGVLELASLRGLLALGPVVDALRKTDFRLDPRLVAQALDKDAARRGIPRGT